MKAEEARGKENAKGGKEKKESLNTSKQAPEQ
jgi:hypothetical protein